jgi:hypothetical protein
MASILALSYNVLLSELTVKWAALTMFPEQSNSASYRARAAIYAHCAEQAVSPGAAAAFRYLEEMCLVIAEVIDVKSGNGSFPPFGSGPHRLSPE